MDDGHNKGFLMLNKTDKIWLDTKKKKKKSRLKQMLKMDSLVNTAAKRIIISHVSMADKNRTFPSEINRNLICLG